MSLPLPPTGEQRQAQAWGSLEGRKEDAGLLSFVISQAGGSSLAFKLSSPGFAPNADGPRKYTCDDPDLSPPLRWTAPPAQARGLALIADDPDAPGGSWVHWVIYAIPADTADSG